MDLYEEAEEQISSQLNRNKDNDQNEKKEKNEDAEQPSRKPLISKAAETELKWLKKIEEAVDMDDLHKIVKGMGVQDITRKIATNVINEISPHYECPNCESIAVDGGPWIYSEDTATYVCPNEIIITADEDYGPCMQEQSPLAFWSRLMGGNTPCQLTFKSKAYRTHFRKIFSNQTADKPEPEPKPIKVEQQLAIINQQLASITMQKAITGATDDEIRILKLTQSIYEIAQQLKATNDRYQNKIANLEHDHKRMTNITAAPTTATPNQQTPTGRMSYSKAARHATEYVEQLPRDNQQEAAAKLLTTGRHPQNNRSVTNKPPVAIRMNKIGTLNDIADITNDHLRNKVQQMRFVNVKGLSRLPYGDIRRLLRTFLIDTATIANIRASTNNTYEFLMYNIEAAEAIKEVFTKNMKGVEVLEEDYAFWKTTNNLDEDTANRIAIHNIARNAAQHHDLAITTALQFRLPPNLRAAFSEELGNYKEGIRKDKEAAATTKHQQ
jgi:hypothetical protein